jgi:hypothetical protein
MVTAETRRQDSKYTRLFKNNFLIKRRGSKNSYVEMRMQIQKYMQSRIKLMEGNIPASTQYLPSRRNLL